VLSRSLKCLCILSLYISIFSSYYATSTFLAHAAAAMGCERTGTLKVTCCQEHVINRSPSNPAGTVVNYCTDCDIGPGGEPNYQNCSERYIQMFEQDPNPSPPPTKSPFSERIPSGVIEQAQPLTQQNPNGANDNVPPQQDFTEQLSSSGNSVDDSVGDDEEQNSDNNAESEENTNENENGQNNTNS